MSRADSVIVDRAPLADQRMEEARQLARDLVVPPRGGPYDRFVPFSTWEKQKAESIFDRLVAQPKSPREDIKNLVGLVDLAGSTSGGEAMGLRSELRDTARRHPQEFIEETGGDLAHKTWELLAESLEPQSETAREGLLCKMHQVRSELAGPKPSGVEWNLADAAALSWADYHRCVIERERLSGREDLKALTYHDQRVDRAQKRFLRSLKALAAVRKLDLTAVQINFNGAIRSDE
ncbi:hypothetical protein [Aquisphaera insulae]|uniref:hypothetical protein n=1 Tax=Aquisphaera insulae TaxID=2712864 RepID=UPI0013ED627B|nr:hypothetical protein [Aquisphaera insulae]